MTAPWCGITFFGKKKEKPYSWKDEKFPLGNLLHPVGIMANISVVQALKITRGGGQTSGGQLSRSFPPTQGWCVTRLKFQSYCLRLNISPSIFLFLPRPLSFLLL